MKKINSNQLKNQIGKIILIKTKELKPEAFFESSIPHEDNYHTVDRCYLLNSANTTSVTLSFLDLRADFGRTGDMDRKRKIPVVDLEKVEASYFLLNKKDLLKIKKDVLFRIECVEDAISSSQKKKKKLQKVVQILG